MFSARERCTHSGSVVAQGPVWWPQGPCLPVQGDSKGWTLGACRQRRFRILPCFNNGCAGWGSLSLNNPPSCHQPVPTRLSLGLPPGHGDRTVIACHGQHSSCRGWAPPRLKRGGVCRETHQVLPTLSPSHCPFLGLSPCSGGSTWAPVGGCRRQRACPHSLARWCQENELQVEAAGGRAVLDGARMAGVLEQAPWLPPCTQGAGVVHMALAMLPVQSCFSPSW